jgi:type VI secretion system VasD/TssJ family lipoprotein
MANKRFQISGLGLMAMALAASCAHAPPTPPPPCPPPEPLHVTLRASPRLNPSDRGEPLATVVRIYQLKGTGKIGVASFDDLMDHDRDALGEDFVAVQEVTLTPGATLTPPLFRSPDATYVAVVGLFRRPTGTSWRAVDRLPPPDPQFCHPAPAPKKGSPPKDPTLRFSLEENRVATIKTP